MDVFTAKEQKAGICSVVTQLSCDHQFCSQCLSFCPPGLCPYPLCSAQRNMKVLVDELEGTDEGSPMTFIDKHHRIVFGERGPNLLKLEERQRCETRKGTFHCLNTARMTISECHHHTCFDCVEYRIHIAAACDEPMYCPRVRCANTLSQSEIAKVAEHKPAAQASCKKLLERMKLPTTIKADKKSSKTDCIVSCSLFRVEGSTKTISIPKVCTVADIVSAFIQIYGIGKGPAVTKLGVYIRTLDEAGKPKYENINTKTLWKKSAQDAKIVDKTNIVIDLQNELEDGKYNK